MLKIEANKKDERSNYIHQGIAQRGFSKVFRLAEHIKVDDARFVDGSVSASAEQLGLGANYGEWPFKAYAQSC